MRSPSSFAVLAALVLSLTPGCGPAHITTPSQPGLPTASATSPLLQLQHDIDGILGQPALAHGYWSVLVRSLKTDDTLYSVNANKLMVPASNMKIVTLAAAAEKLGWDYRYETQLVATGSIVSGTLDGDLVVVGSGDPTLMITAATARPFDAWAAEVKRLGISRITGRVVGDGTAFDSPGFGFGWSWDDLPDSDAAAVAGLQFNENAVRMIVTPGRSADEPTVITLDPPTSGLSVRNHVQTGAPGSTVHLESHRLPGNTQLEVRGSVPPGEAPAMRLVAVDNPTLFFASALRQALIDNGVNVLEPAVDIAALSDDPMHHARTSIATFRSAPLSEIAVRLMKVSQNLYAETLLMTMSEGRPATAAAGLAGVQAVLTPWGVSEGLILRDGSGLTRYDYVTSEALVRILTHVDRDPRLRDPFEASLPVAGRDGTLANRMKGTAAEGNARGKTGSLSNVRALSGFVATTDREPLVFSIVANNFDTGADVVNKATDAIVIRLATFKRQ
jgi:D-alanyl-D-alanine carboxypeptidase/D-alanyl-D-alanine-endopeptidase (penicillin-binding protein 4)